MSELFRAFAVVSILSFVTFWMASKALPHFIPSKEFKRWRMLWFGVLFAAFLPQNIWLYLALVFIVIKISLPRSLSIRVIYFLLLICVIPQLSFEIPGLAGIRYLFQLTYPRLLIILLFLIPFISQKHPIPLLKLTTDKYILMFVILIIALKFRDNTLTNSLRAMLMIFIDMFLPYFMISRYVTTQEQMNKALLALFIGITPFALIGIFETIRHWHLFTELTFTLTKKSNHYDIRAGSLRAYGPFSNPIVLGYVMVIAFGLLLYLRDHIKSKNRVILVGLTIICCLLSTMARGPWLGCGLLVSVYIFTGKAAIKRLTLMGLTALALLPLLSLSTSGQKFLDLLPFIGSTRSGTIDYRSRLIDMSWIVFQRHPWFGSTVFLETPEMETMRQGRGVIDVVNSYIQIALGYGGIGVLCFLAIFFSLLFQCYRVIKRLPSEESELIHMGRTLLATLTSILFIIFTVSSVNYVPLFYWVFFGIVAAYINIANKRLKIYYADAKKSVKMLKY